MVKELIIGFSNFFKLLSPGPLNVPKLWVNQLEIKMQLSGSVYNYIRHFQFMFFEKSVCDSDSDHLNCFWQDSTEGQFLSKNVKKKSNPVFALKKRTPQQAVECIYVCHDAQIPIKFQFKFYINFVYCYLMLYVVVKRQTLVLTLKQMCR